jgi:hypothetical protein
MTTTRRSRAIPNPGSDEAVKRGCECPILDNEYGYGNPVFPWLRGFIITQGCPLHDPTKSLARGVTRNRVYKGGRNVARSVKGRAKK